MRVQIQVMQKLVSGIGIAALACGLWPSFAAAQSTALLESVRLQRPNVLAKAESELLACETAKPKCDRLRHLSLLTGYLRLAEGDATGALKQLLAQPAPPGLEPYLEHYRGTAAFYAKDYEAAAAHFALARKGPELLARKARGRQAEAHAALGDLEGTRALLEDPIDGPELLFLRARTRGALGDVKGEKKDLQTALLRYPGHPDAEAAHARLLKIDRTPFSFEDRLQRAETLVDSGDPDASLAELERLEKEKLDRGATAKAKVALVRARALYAKGDAEAGEAQLKKARKGNRDTAFEAAMFEARRALKSDNALARKLMAAIDRKYAKTVRESDQAGFYAAWLALQAGDLEEAVSAFDRFPLRHRRSRKRDEALWYKALALIRLERYGEAKAALQSLGQQFSRSSLVPQARYWAARCDQLSAAEVEKVAVQYEQVISLFPNSFYAALSVERLRELGRTPPPTFAIAPKLLEVEAPEDLKTALALAEVGLFRDFRELIEAEVGGVRSSEEAVALGHALLQFNEYGNAYALANRLLWAEAFGDKSAAALAMFYPRAFHKSVEPEATTRGIDPHFVYAIMRRESTFLPDVKSHADAFGLMQILPKTAKEIAKRLSMEPPAAEELYSPSLNIKFGTWYLSELYKRFGHPALAAAAYNAGPTAVTRWLSSNGAMPLDLFVEQIPYKETRGYVKQVLADYQSYHALYGQKMPKLELSLPEPGEGVNF